MRSTLFLAAALLTTQADDALAKEPKEARSPSLACAANTNDELVSCAKAKATEDAALNGAYRKLTPLLSSYQKE